MRELFYNPHVTSVNVTWVNRKRHVSHWQSSRLTFAIIKCDVYKLSVPGLSTRHALLFGILVFPIYIGKLFLDVNLFELEVLAEERPRHIEHFLGIQVDVDGK